MQRRNVDLPEPDGPSRQATSRGWTSSEMPLRTSSRPKRLWTASALTIGPLMSRRSLVDAAGKHGAPQSLQRRQRRVARRAAAEVALDVVLPDREHGS